MPSQPPAPLVQRLLVRPYRTISFKLDKRITTYPDGKINRQVLEIVELGNSKPSLWFRIACAEYGATQERKTELRQHYFFEPEKPIGDGHTYNSTHATAIWTIDRAPRITAYNNGIITFHESTSIERLENVIRWM